MAFRVRRNSDLNSSSSSSSSSSNNLTFLRRFALARCYSLDSLEEDLTSLCEDPANSKTVSYLLFEKSVDLGVLPSPTLCGRVMRMHSKKKDYEAAFLTYNKLRVTPRYLLHVYDANLVLDALCSNGFASEAVEFLAQMERNPPFMAAAPDRVSFNILIKGFCREKKSAEALKVKERMDEEISPDIVTYNILIAGLFNEGKAAEAMALLEEEMKGRKGIEPDAVTWTTLVKGFCGVGDVDRAEATFQEMSRRGIATSRVAYSCLLQGFCRKGDLCRARSLFDHVMKKGVQPDSNAVGLLIRGLCSKGRSEEAEAIKSRMATQQHCKSTS
ncbi:hypothetical protein M569_06082 [Genlisea aurea]|uniref:Pentacotripeptide-repeat region of PRORP domain-containing protein n=1 Tax=Genlisea aurea TaxID=192259 RepID=S8DZB3_9LAMI|nr:hypothetical protein M569_06082 [Genlisea aurea]